MNEKLTMAYLSGKTALQNALYRFTKEEKGASDIVAVILLIVIVVAVAVIFRRELTAIVEKAFAVLNEEFFTE